MLRDKLDVARMAIAERIGERAPFGRVAFGILERGNDRERRQARKRLDVVRRLHSVVHVLAQDREADTADEADEQRQRDVTHFRRTRRTRRNHRGIDDTDVGGLQRRRNAGFLELGQQPVVERFVGLGVALEDVVLHHALGHEARFGFLLLKRAGEQILALLRFVKFAAEACEHGFFLALEILVDFLQLGLEALDLRKVGAILSEGFGVLTAEIGAALEQVLNGAAVANLRHDVGIALLREVVHRLLFHAIALRVDQLFVELRKPLRRDVLFVVHFPDLILAFVVEAGVFGIFDFDFQLVELIGEPRGGGRRGVVMAAPILVDEVANVRVDDLRGQLGAVGLVGDVHQAAVGHALDAEGAEKRAEFGRAFLIGEVAGGDRLGRRVGAANTRQDAGTDRLERQRLAGQNLGLRLDVIFEIEHVVVGIGALERQDVRGFAAEFDARRGDVNRPHAERGDRDDGGNREHERQNQPLVLAEDEQVIPQVWFARCQIPGGAQCGRRLGNDINGGRAGRHVARDHVEFVGHGYGTNR